MDIMILSAGALTLLVVGFLISLLVRQRRTGLSSSDPAISYFSPTDSASNSASYDDASSSAPCDDATGSDGGGDCGGDGGGGGNDS